MRINVPSLQAIVLLSIATADQKHSALGDYATDVDDGCCQK
jgi:hypothetical protein